MFFIVSRFSLLIPRAGEWIISSEEFSASYASKLFEESRLKVRAEIFFKISLPIINEISKRYKICHIIQYSKNLPKFYKDILLSYSNKYDFIRLDCIDVKDSRTDQLYKFIIPSELKKFSNNNLQIFGLFNLDDDDLLSIDFIDRMSNYLREENVGRLISFGKGLTGFYNNQTNKIENLRVAYCPKINIGLTKICTLNLINGDYVMPISIDHSKSDFENIVLLDSREISYFWMRSIDQDTNIFSRMNVGLKDKIFQDLDSYPVVMTSDTGLKKFPFLIDYVVEKKLTQYSVLSNFELSEDLFEITLPEKCSGEIRIEYLLEDTYEIENSAVLVFGRIDEQGDHINFNGLVLSDNPDYGFYRYMSAKNKSGTITFELPSGVGIEKFRIGLWGECHKLTIKELVIGFSNTIT